MKKNVTKTYFFLNIQFIYDMYLCTVIDQFDMIIEEITL